MGWGGGWRDSGSFPDGPWGWACLHDSLSFHWGRDGCRWGRDGCGRLVVGRELRCGLRRGPRERQGGWCLARLPAGAGGCWGFSRAKRSGKTAWWATGQPCSCAGGGWAGPQEEGRKCQLCVLEGTRSRLRGWVPSPGAQSQSRSGSGLVPPAALACPGLLGVSARISLCLPTSVACEAEGPPPRVPAFLRVRHSGSCLCDP